MRLQVYDSVASTYTSLIWDQILVFPYPQPHFYLRVLTILDFFALSIIVNVVVISISLLLLTCSRLNDTIIIIIIIIITSSNIGSNIFDYDCDYNSDYVCCIKTNVACC